MTDARIGLVGLDTSHVTAFTKLLNDPGVEHHVPGGRITVAFAGGSPDLEASRSRVDGFTRELHDDWEVKILPSPRDVADAVDVVFITAVDSRTHLAYVQEVAPAGKPMFIDKPFAQTRTEAEQMIAAARRHGVAITGGSSLRFADRLTELLDDDALGPIIGCDVFGPMAVNDLMPGLLWYGCHCIDVLQRVMGRGVADVSAAISDNADVYTYVYSDGRVATYRGGRNGHHQFGIAIHRAEGFQQATLQPGPGQRPWYAAMLGAILEPLKRNEPPVAAEDILEVMHMMDIGNQARERVARSV